MSDLEVLEDMLQRAGREQVKSLTQVNEDSGYMRSVLDPPWDSCEDCATEILMTGQWTGELNVHFASNGSIRHLYVSGD